MVARARAAAGLSRRALATRAGVPTSTVSRIEQGEVDPTVTMLARLLGAAGEQLELHSRALSDDEPTLAGLAGAYDSTGRGTKIDWTALRAFLDWLRGHPSAAEAAIATPPPRTGSILDQILAAMAEEVASRAGIPPPRWSRSVPAAEERWSPPATPRMLADAERTTPAPFRRRNIILPAGSLWRGAA